jgi:hypothetical protein
MTTDVTRTCQDDGFTSAGLVAALEGAWSAIRDRHRDVPAVVLVVGSGSPSKPNGPMMLGQFAASRWQHGTDRLPEVVVSGEGLARTPAEVLTTLLHEAAHGLAHVRGIKDTSRQGRWHNRQFAVLADELGLIASKDDKLGWSPCELRPATRTTYADVIDGLGVAMRVYRHPNEVTPGKSRKDSNNGLSLTCGCPRKIRASAAVVVEGPILCGVCGEAFLTDEQRDEDGQS